MAFAGFKKQLNKANQVSHLLNIYIYLCRIRDACFYVKLASRLNVKLNDKVFFFNPLNRLKIAFHIHLHLLC